MDTPPDEPIQEGMPEHTQVYVGHAYRHVEFKFAHDARLGTTLASSRCLSIQTAFEWLMYAVSWRGLPYHSNRILGQCFFVVGSVSYRWAHDGLKCMLV